jgi:ubiquinone/menaquinone biosynthesis C-methylase UbiE
MKKELETDAIHNLLWGGLRERILAEQINAHTPRDVRNILDVGCGDGYLLHILQKNSSKDIKYYGLDQSLTRLKRVLEKIPLVKNTLGEITLLPFRNNSFDVVICSEVLEHVLKYRTALQELLRITKKYVIITVPYDQELVKIICPKCEYEHFLSGHIHRFTKKSIIKDVKQYPHTKIKKLTPFYTIYTYNNMTFYFPQWIRYTLDRCVTSLATMIPFFKGNYIIIILEKNNP